MRGCGKAFEPTSSPGLVCLTWGIVLEFQPGLLAISWTEDSTGDPFRIGLPDPAGFLRIDSLVHQDVSGFSPWSSTIGCRLVFCKVLTYASNYARPPGGSTWHSVPWGLLMGLGPNRLLAAAAHHDNPFGGLRAPTSWLSPGLMPTLPGSAMRAKESATNGPKYDPPRSFARHQAGPKLHRARRQ